jgi:transposase
MEVAMSFREVRVYEVRELLRWWVEGVSQRQTMERSGFDRKTVRRYVEAAMELGVVQGGGDDQLSDEVVAAVLERVRPKRRDGHGEGWATCMAHHDVLRGWLAPAPEGEGLTVRRAGELLARRGVIVPERTLHRYALEVLAVGRSARRSTVRVADGEPGAELQVDYGAIGWIELEGRRRRVWALIFTAVYSRHTFVHVGVEQTLERTIAGFEAAWAFFGGVFAVVVPDNMKTIVDRANATAPTFNQAFADYAADRGFLIDAARVRTPTDKPRVERTVQFVQGSLMAGDTYTSLDALQAEADRWCRERAGRRVHGTTRQRPIEVFVAEERPKLKPVPVGRYDVPVYARPKVHRDHHIQVAQALYSVPGNRVGQHVDVVADSRLVRISQRGVLIRVHERTRPGGRRTDAADLPDGTAVYALRDLDRLHTDAAAHGEHVGVYAARLLDHELPWTKMRQVYKLISLAKRWGDDRVDAACQAALEVDAVDVGLIDRMIRHANEHADRNVPVPDLPAAAGAPARFARDGGHFATRSRNGQAQLRLVTEDGEILQ